MLLLVKNKNNSSNKKYTFNNKYNLTGAPAENPLEPLKTLGSIRNSLRKIISKPLGI